MEFLFDSGIRTGKVRFMRAEELKELLDVEPFVPLRIHLTDGKAFDIYHPDAVLVLRGRVDIGVPADDDGRIMDRVEHCSLLHVVRVEELRNEKPGRTSGSSQ
jgi:hypothetical protein